MSSPSLETRIAQLAREEQGKLLAVLVRVFGPAHLQLAEDVVQETLLSALDKWQHGLPDNPQAWLYTVAKRKLIDLLRHERRTQEHRLRLRPVYQTEYALSGAVEQLFEEHAVNDSQLRLLLACLRPELTQLAQLALTLHVLGGFTAKEIARGLLSSEEAIFKQLQRAKAKLRELPQELTAPDQLDVSLMPLVLQVLYLLFNEGHSTTLADDPIDKELCLEAMRLCLLVVNHPLANSPEAEALLALMCYHAARFPARMDELGRLVPLAEQDRSLYTRALIARGDHYFSRATSHGIVSAYHIEAGIAGLHVHAPSWAATNWPAIELHYDKLLALRPHPTVRLQRAICWLYSRGPEEALTELDDIAGLEGNAHYHAARAHCYEMLKQAAPARDAYLEAIALSQSAAERAYLGTRLDKLVGV